MISCVFNGRLGNNLFQIANVVSMAKRLGTDFIVPENTWAGHRGWRPADLSMFKYEFPRGEFSASTEYGEQQFHYMPIPYVNNFKVSGFYQSWKYFDDVKDELLNHYFQPSDTVVQSLSKYNISTNSLGISVRRGDYLMLQNNHCVLSIDYYQEAINKYFLENTEEIYIFSDDLNWCRSVFGNEVHYVTDDIGTQLFLMSKMKNLILSNSTFAWWGAYLNQNNGIIVAPDPWFGPDNAHINTKDLYCPNWVKQKHTLSFQSYEMSENFYN
jgi:hypothetical protein